MPCNEDGSPKITIVTGFAPKLNTLNVGNAINNGTLDEKALDLSDEGRSCLYHSELPKGITDIALINTSIGTLSFYEGGNSVTVSAHGTPYNILAQMRPQDPEGHRSLIVAANFFSYSSERTSCPIFF